MENKYFIPTIRTGERGKEVTKGSVQFVLSMSSPHLEKIGAILMALKKQMPLLEIQADENYSNAVVIMINEERCQLSFTLTFKGDVIEVSCNEQCYTDNLQSAVEKIVKAFHDMVQKRIYRNNIRYHFAVPCQADKSPFFNPHQKRHILPKSKFCQECKEHKIEETPLIKAWINELKKVTK